MTFETPVQRVPTRGRSVAVGLLAGAVAVAGLLVWRPPGTPEASSDATPDVTPGLYADPPAADRFQPIWSVVGVRELATGGSAMTQIPVQPSTGQLQGLSSAQLCALARERSLDVAVLPGWTLRIFGAIALRGGHGWVQLTSIDAANPACVRRSRALPAGDHGSRGGPLRPLGPVALAAGRLPLLCGRRRRGRSIPLRLSRRLRRGLR